MSGNSWSSEIVHPVAPLLEIMAENGTPEGTSAIAFSQLLEGLRELGIPDEAIRNTFEYEFNKEVRK
jgi:hypothetical protein